MLDSHVDDGFNKQGQGGVPLGRDESISSPNLQAQDLEISKESFVGLCVLPDLQLKSLLSHMDILASLREQGEVRNLLGFQPSHIDLEPVAEISKEDACPVPYFIPELEMSCVEAKQFKELTLAAVEETNISGVSAYIPNLPGIEALSVLRTEEQNVLGVEEPRMQETLLPERRKEANLTELQDIEVTNIEESKATEMTEVSEPLVIKPVIPEPQSPIAIDQKTTQIGEPKPMLGRCPGIISSLIGLKPIWRPSVSLSFGDREQRRKIRSEEAMKQQTSMVLKSLIKSINLFNKFEASCQGKPKDKLSQLERGKSTLIYTREFRQNVFQPEMRKDSLACGEPYPERRPILHREGMRRLYRLDASDGWASRSQDLDSSECSDCNTSGIRSTLRVREYSLEILQIKRPIANWRNIESSGRILFSQPVKLYRFNSLKKWQREGIDPGPLEHFYTGHIKIMERQGLYYILLREQSSGFLLVYTRVDGNWHIGYMANRTNSCGWFNFNYAFCPEGTPEHFACTFREPSHAAEFVARIRNLVIKSRLLSVS